MVTAQDQQHTDEAALVYEWRIEKFEEMRDHAGVAFTPRQVRVLAALDCDLHRARKWLAEGCDILTAFDILS